MDLVSSGSRVVVTMEHTAKGCVNFGSENMSLFWCIGAHKILNRCSLPLTAPRSEFQVEFLRKNDNSLQMRQSHHH
jgi:acyl CoA:acetate/3-ketoacid CoA transferase beta subunit